MAWAATSGPIRSITFARRLSRKRVSRDLQVSDLKDFRVYGILALLKLGLIKVKYELEVQEIYRSFSEAVIDDSGNLDILNLCGKKHTLPGLPCWVPDFNPRRSSCHLPSLHEIQYRTLRVGDPQPDIYVTKAWPGLRFRKNGKGLVVEKTRPSTRSEL